MRALHVIPGVAPRYGGPSTAIREMAAALARCPGVAVEVAATDADGAGGRLAEHFAADFPVPLRLFRRTLSERWKYSRGLGRWLRARVGDYDVVHVHAVWSYATTAACRAAARAGVPVVLRPCGMLSDYTLGRSAWVKRGYWALVERGNMAAVRAFHATSRAEADEVRRLVGPAARVEVIPNGVDATAFDLPPAPRVLPAAGGRPVILFLGRLHPKKGLTDLLLPALARLGQGAFLAVAGGPDDHAPGYEAEVRRTVEQLGLADRVALLGPVAPAERWALLDGAAVFALPSRSENFGIAVAEAMARGVPVVVTDGVQAADHVTAAGAGRVVPQTVEAVAGALAGLLADPAGRAEAGARAKAYARAEFDWDRIAGRIASLYEELVGTAHPPLPAAST